MLASSTVVACKYIWENGKNTKQHAFLFRTHIAKLAPVFTASFLNALLNLQITVPFPILWRNFCDLDGIKFWCAIGYFLPWLILFPLHLKPFSLQVIQQNKCKLQVIYSSYLILHVQAEPHSCMQTNILQVLKYL